jgi:hypothetical protein
VHSAGAIKRAISGSCITCNMSKKKFFYALLACSARKPIFKRCWHANAVHNVDHELRHLE